MRTAILSLTMVAALVLAAAPVDAGKAHAGIRLQIDPGQVEHHPEQVLVRFKADAAPAKRQAAHAAAGALQTVHEIHAVPGLFVMQVAPGKVKTAVAAYSADSSVLYAEPDYRLFFAALPDDPDLVELWGMHNIGQTVDGYPGTAGADIDAPEAWDIWTGDQDFRVAVIDTGVDYTHPDLAANIWTNPGEIADNGIDDDGNGYIDDVHGYDFGDFDPDPMDEAVDGHGTHCAGTIGAVGNDGVGVVGVNWRCSIVALKVDGAGMDWYSAAILAIQYCIDNGITISSNSWGLFYSQALYDVIEASQSIGHIFVAAAGNMTVDNDSSEYRRFPASFDLANIIAVAATDNDDNPAAFTSWGSTTVDLGAPGVTVYSTIPGNEYDYGWGTSMATPHVAGVTTLVRSRFPDLPWQSVRGTILDTVRLSEPLAGITVTGGVVNPARALARLTADCDSSSTADGDDISGGAADDCDGNGVPDSCEFIDCDSNGVLDACDILAGTHQDCDGNSVPDTCEPADCNSNGVSDGCDIADGISLDCNSNWIPDECDISDGSSPDADTDGVPDECEARFVYVDGGCGDDSWSGDSSDCGASGGAGPMATIGAAMAAAPDGSTVLVADGTYTGDGNTNLELNTRPLRLECANAAGGCVIDCEGAGRFVSIRAASGVVVHGFSVTNGKKLNGGAMAVAGNGAHTVTDCSFSGNTSGVWGAGIFLVWSTLTVDGCRFIENSATDGGGLFTNEAVVNLTGCTFSNNTATDGGGLSTYVSTVNLTGCTFSNNSADSGGGISHNWGVATVHDCSFDGNSAEIVGGGVENYDSEITLTNSVFTNNTATEGGGFLSVGGQPKQITNCSFVGNGATTGGGIYNRGLGFMAANTIAWGNTADQIYEFPFPLSPVTYSCVEGGYVGAANIDADPLFVDPAAGDYHLSAASPAINAGSNLAAGLLEEDIEGNPRIQSCRVDMGAYESPYAPASPIDCNGNGFDDDCDLFDGTSDDYDLDFVPDDCQDCNENGIADACDLDCDTGLCADNPLGCGGSVDDDGDGVPDECVDLAHTAWLEIAASLDGEQGSTWRTDVVALNDNDADASVELVLHTVDGDTILAGTVAAGGQRVFEDPVGQMGLTGKGSLELRSDQPLQVCGRVYNQADTGTFGQFFDGYSVDDGLSAGDEVWLLGLRQMEGEFRTNISVTNTGAEIASVTITLYGTDGSELGSYVLAVGPLMLVQDLEPMGYRVAYPNLGWGYAKVAVDSGSGVFTSASVVDDRTNDATTIPMTAASGDSWLEIAAHLDGEEGSQWRTDVVALNQTASDATVDFELHSDDGAIIIFATIAANSQGVFEDIVGTTGRFNGKGSLEIVSDQPLTVVGRIYNQADTGTFGQYCDGLASADGLAAGASAWLLGLRQAEGEFRTNISVTNTGSEDATVTVTLYSADGNELLSYPLAVAAGMMVQDTEPFADRASQPDLGWGFAKVVVDSGSGVFSSASVVDDNTNDATTVPMKR